MPDYYNDFKRNVSDLEAKQKEIASAADIRTLNQKEREAQMLLFSLQHTAMNLGYWIQDTSRSRRKNIMYPPVIEGLKEEPKEEPKPKAEPKKKTTKKKTEKAKKGE